MSVGLLCDCPLKPEVDDRKRDERRQSAIWQRRIQWYRDSGRWDEAWGPVPEEAKQS